MDSLVPGTLLARRYRLLDRIGVGGMSVIWRAHDEMLERQVAVKVLAADLAAEPRFRERVRDEARAAAALVHPHITTIYDYGEVFDSDGGVTAYVVMELLEGEPLSARLTAGPMPWPAALRIGAEVAEALAAAHRHGIVHRDVTSDNVMLTAGGAKVLDFGIATTIGAPDEDDDGSTFGTPAYVAPERLDGRRAKPATDTYALGVLLYEMLTGQPPYPADTWEELAETRRDQPPPLTVAGLPAKVAELCHRCLAVDPRERPTANQVAWTLRKHLPGAGSRRQRVARRVLVAAGAAASLALGLVVGATLLGADPRDLPNPVANEPELAVRPDSPATDPAAPGAGQSSAPTATAPPASSAPAPPPAESAEVTLRTVYQVIEDGRAVGDIREDVALDLHQLIDNLERELDQGVRDLPSVARILRDKVADRAAEGAMSPETADQLRAALDQLESA
ncbi:MAG TPA: serine/threonine-protein kinase [Natronosporangium sp.]